ncbi:hypothetical protein [Pseudoalteromonas luteoviolacea]|uniref:Uncharacterized protein n=1 Tax=Pseudoalteromonas luteoviolacea DSM 6061 TaxID=1365250 RepID=A0A166VT05_9GAMM|nr:hypothetical protein [Pseudoalteromonas luteoviolacea]KZN33669.1 hypothetical protein N475_20050 [Pseudoalteromonas luteoviolacea DSM 6061]KZN53761.1 hypothetical protein N474_19510 [Pseudoalteromonas luteoviolacea CPMOR-2]MBE0389583.1 hypothetical protein [Pseudoalteromonas luteoviolacea DSM 6061]TQF67778.1 hypothetical protein FLM44_21605 [Pseudoalteromonas luteoviolacea]
MDQKLIEQLNFDEYATAEMRERADINKHHINATLLVDDDSVSEQDRIKLLTELNLYRNSASIEVEEVTDGVFNLRFALLN